MHLEKVFEGGVGRGVGNERQGIVRQELCGLAQCCSSSLQVLLEVGNPLFKLGSVLETDSSAQMKLIYSSCLRIITLFATYSHQLGTFISLKPRKKIYFLTNTLHPYTNITQTKMAYPIKGILKID